MDDKLQKYSGLSVLKEYFDRSPEIIGKDGRLVEMIENVKNFNKKADRDVQYQYPKKFTGIALSCMLAACEAITLKVCKILSNIKESSDVPASNSSNPENLLSVFDGIRSKFMEARSEIGEILDILCAEVENDSRFLTYKNICVSSYASAFSRVLKPVSVERHLRDMIDKPGVEKSISNVFACILCLESRRCYLFSKYFTSLSGIDTTVAVVPLSIKKHIRTTISNVNSFDVISRIYCIFREFSLFPQSELDSRDDILNFPRVLKRLLGATDPTAPDNKLALQFVELRIFCKDKLVATAYEYANREIQTYRMTPDDILMFVMNPAGGAITSSKMNLSLEQKGSDLPQDTSLVPEIVYDPETFSSRIESLDVVHLCEPRPGKRITFGQGLNYPTVQHTLYLLRKICVCIREEACGEFGKYIVDMYFSSLLYPAGVICKSESYTDAALFVISNSLNIYEDLCIFMLMSDDPAERKVEARSIPALNQLEQNIIAVSSGMIEKFASSADSIFKKYISSAEEDAARKSPVGTSLPGISSSLDLETVVSSTISEYAHVFRKIRAYLSDAFFARQIAEALVNKFFADIRAIEETLKGTQDLKIIMDVKDEMRDTLLEQLESLGNSYITS